MTKKKEKRKTRETLNSRRNEKRRRTRCRNRVIPFRRVQARRLTFWHDAFWSRERYLFVLTSTRTKFGRSFADRSTKGNQRTGRRRRAKTISTFFLVACCKVQKLFLTFRIFYRHTISTFMLRRVFRRHRSMYSNRMTCMYKRKRDRRMDEKDDDDDVSEKTGWKIVYKE